MSILQVTNIWFESTVNTRINCLDANTTVDITTPIWPTK